MNDGEHTGTRVRVTDRGVLMGAVIGVSLLPGAAVVLSRLTQPATAEGTDLCMVHRLTGFWCPLCGGTRATRELLHGDVLGALGYNPFAIAFEVLVLVLVVRWLLARRAGHGRPLLTVREAVLLFAAAAVFAVVRNLPGMWVHLGPLLGPPG